MTCLTDILPAEFNKGSDYLNIPELLPRGGASFGSPCMYCNVVIKQCCTWENERGRKLLMWRLDFDKVYLTIYRSDERVSLSCLENELKK